MTAFARILLPLWFSGFAGVTLASELVAVVVGHEIRVEDLGPVQDPEARAAELARLVRRRLFVDYVAVRGLAATPQEIEALRSYDAEFARKDRAQRRRKLEELGSRLDSKILSDAERARLVEFRDILQRMADAEAVQDRQPAPATSSGDGVRVSWIELWKMHRALYEEYGGEVLLVEYGPYPKDAWLRLLADHESAGDLRFGAPVWRDRVFSRFTQVSGVRLPPEDVDFTPYWKKPIPPSYFPDHAPNRSADGR